MTLYDLPYLTGGIAALLLALLAKYIYRVTFHPLAQFPGPKWAALTSLYGGYYDLHPSRSYCKQFAALHDKYGPIVRIWPNELHIRDVDAYNQIYRMGTKFEKHIPFYNLPVLKDSYFISNSRRALMRKSMQSPLFSKEAVRNSEHLITDMLAKFLGILSGYASRARPVDLSMGLTCLAADVSMNYGFQKPVNALDAEDFGSEIIQAAEANIKLFFWSIHFQKTLRAFSWVATRLPRWFIRRFMKPIALVDWCLGVCREQIVYLQTHPASEDHIRTVFDISLRPNREKEQFTPTVEEMAADAFTLLNAGTDTTSHTMVVVTWALLNQPHMMQRLKAELKVAMPGRNDTVDWAGLEGLPYLRAIIKEGLRLSSGVPGRLPRIVPHSGAIFCGHDIPAGTLVSSSSCVYHLDPHAFHDPEAFRPERWLADSPSDLKEMERKYFPFSRGSRMCVGSNVAYAELYLTLAHLFRRFDVSNYGTSEADMEWDDCFVPVTRGHLKVMVKDSVN